MTSIGIARCASQVIQIRKLDLSAVKRYAYRAAMLVLVAILACAPDHACIVSCTGGSSGQAGFRLRCSDNILVASHAEPICLRVSEGNFAVVATVARQYVQA